MDLMSRYKKMQAAIISHRATTVSTGMRTSSTPKTQHLRALAMAGALSLIVLSPIPALADDCGSTIVGGLVDGALGALGGRVINNMFGSHKNNGMATLGGGGVGMVAGVVDTQACKSREAALARAQAQAQARQLPPQPVYQSTVTQQDRNLAAMAERQAYGMPLGQIVQWQGPNARGTSQVVQQGFDQSGLPWRRIQNQAVIYSTGQQLQSLTTIRSDQWGNWHVSMLNDRPSVDEKPQYQLG